MNADRISHLHRIRNNPDLRESFGKRLRELRLKKGLTQEKLAELSAVSVELVSLIERGKSSPSFRNLEKLAAALDLPVFELFHFAERGPQ